MRNIKAKGKGLPVNAQFSIEEEDDGEDDDFGDTGMIDDEDSLSDEEDPEDEDEDEDDEFGQIPNDSDSDGEDDEDEDGFQSRETIDRLKDDLFADDSGEESDSGIYFA